MRERSEGSEAEAVARAVSALAHEINSPLAAVVLELELATEDLGALVLDGALEGPAADTVRSVLEGLRQARIAAERARTLSVRHATPTPISSPGPVRRARILVVDDDPALVRALTRALEKEHEVSGLSDARGALAELSAGSGEPYDLVLCDVNMPYVTGMDLHEELSAAFPELARTMVFLCGGVFTERARAFLARVENVRIDKPFDTVRLRELVRGLVAPRSA